MQLSPKTLLWSVPLDAFFEGRPIRPPLSLGWCGLVGKYCQGPCRICHMPCRCHMAILPQDPATSTNSCLAQPRQAAGRVLRMKSSLGRDRTGQEDAAHRANQTASLPTSQPRRPYNQPDSPSSTCDLGSALQARDTGGGRCRPTEINKAVCLCGDAHCRVYHVD